MKARIEVVEGWQLAADDGDGVVVKGRLMLPCNDEGVLTEELRFGARLRTAGYLLTADWGLYDGAKNMRYRNYKATADTYEEATKKVLADILSDMQLLKDALKQRREALKKAGKFKSMTKEVEL